MTSSNNYVGEEKYKSGFQKITSNYNIKKKKRIKGVKSKKGQKNLRWFLNLLTACHVLRLITTRATRVLPGRPVVKLKDTTVCPRETSYLDATINIGEENNRSNKDKHI